MDINSIIDPRVPDGTATNQMLQWNDTTKRYEATLTLTGLTSVATTRLFLPLTNDPANPSIAFGDGDSGFYESGDDTISVALGGNKIWQMNNSTFSSIQDGGALINERRSLTNPTLLPRGTDAATGIGGTDGGGDLSLVVGDVAELIASSSGVQIVGNLGLTTDTDLLQLADNLFTVNGDIKATTNSDFGPNANGTYLTSAPYAITDTYLNIADSGPGKWANLVVQGFYPRIRMINTNNDLNEKFLTARWADGAIFDLRLGTDADETFVYRAFKLDYANQQSTLYGDIAIEDTLRVGSTAFASVATFEVSGTSIFYDKIMFTQDDGNEAIDSLADGYMDYLATTGHRFNNDIDITGDGIFSGDINLENTINATQVGVVTKNNVRFMHNFEYGEVGSSATPAGENFFAGVNAGNFSIGSAATSTTHGSYNTGVGCEALTALALGWKNNAIGTRALTANTSGYDNNAMGYQSLRYNTTGYDNCAVGSLSMFFSQAGHHNVAIGFGAGFGASANSYDYNTFIGANSGYGCTTGSRNICVGWKSGENITTESNLLIVSNVDEASIANEQAGAILYGVMNPTAESQTLRVNASLTTSYGRIISVTEDTDATTTVASTDHHISIQYTDTGANAATLPAISSSNHGQVFHIKDADYNASANNITVNTTGADTIEDEASGLMTGDGECWTVVANDTTNNWEIQ